MIFSLSQLGLCVSKHGLELEILCRDAERVSLRYI